MNRLAAVLWLGCASFGWAQATEAERQAADRFQQGSAAYAQGRPAEAAQHFDEAYRLAPHAGSLYNAAVAWQAAGELARAADALELALGLRQLSEAHRRDATARLSTLNPLLALLEVPGPLGATVTVAHVREATVPARAHLSPGLHRVQLKGRDGRVSTTEVRLRAGDRRVLEVELPAVLEPRAAVEPSAAPAAVVVAPSPPRTPAVRAASLVLWVTAALSAGASGYLGIRAYGARDRYYASGYTDAAARDEASTFRTWTNVGWGATAGLAVTALLVWLLGPRGPEVTSSAP